MATAEQDIPGYPFFLQEDPASTDQIYYSAKDFRRYTGALQKRAGTLGSSDLLVQQANNIGFKVKVLKGYANLDGGYIVHVESDTEVILPGTGWKPTSGTVTHKVWVTVYDEYVSGIVNKAKLVVTQDTGAGAPNPTGAAAYLQLATISVTSTQANIQNSNIVNSSPNGGTTGDFIGLHTYLQSAYVDAPLYPSIQGIGAYYSNGQVRMVGRIAKGAGTVFDQDTEIYFGNTHPNLIPKYHNYITGCCSANETSPPGGSLIFRLTVLNDGRMTARVPTGNKPKYLIFDGITYYLD